MNKFQTNKETFLHILTVRSLLMQCIKEITKRSNEHDSSKLDGLELDTFAEKTELLKTLEYDSQEYKECLESIKPALEHHYSNNSHHPEYYANGIEGMNLFDVLEMLCDWTASTYRTKNGNIELSLEKNKARFNIDDQLYKILKNTLPLIHQFETESNVKISYTQE